MLTSQEGTVVWGFMLENTLFTKFEDHNHALIESAYRQRKSKKASHYIHIVDMNLPKPYKAKVYFGVAQNHLRMPGTRYYVTRKVIKSTTSSQTSTPISIPATVPFQLDLSLFQPSTNNTTVAPLMTLPSNQLTMPTQFYSNDNYYGNQQGTTLESHNYNELDDLIHLITSITGYQEYLLNSNLLLPYDLSYYNY